MIEFMALSRHDDGCVPEGFRGFNALKHLASAQSRHENVQQHDHAGMLLQIEEGLVAVSKLDAFVAVSSELLDERITQGRLVINHHDGAGKWIL